MKGLLILLAILKGIGIVLLALLLILMLLVLVVLLSPIRYRLAGEKKAEFGGSFGVSWLFGAVKISGSYTPAEALRLKVKLFWFTLLGKDTAKKTEKEKKNRQKKKKKPKKEVQKPDLQAAEKTAPKQPEEFAQEAEQTEQAQTEQQAEPAEQIKQQRMEQKQPKTVRRVKLSEIAERAPEEDLLLPEEDLPEGENFFTGEESQTKKKEKIPPIVKEIWSIEEKKKIFKALQKLLQRLVKGILPGDFFLKATIGTGDPTTTGYVLALAGVLTAKFGDAIQIKGNFAQAAAEDIEVRLKGKIRLGQLLWAVLAFILTKPVRKVMRKMIRFLRKKDG